MGARPITMLKRSQQYTPPVTSRSPQHSSVKPQSRHSSDVYKRQLVDSTKLYEPAEALDLCAKTGKAKFDETVEIHVRLGVDLSLIHI